ncbi:1050_t:CDS:2, partial [Dentiscutata erythropus]
EMTTQKIVWNEKLHSVWDKTYLSLNSNIHKTITQQEKHRKKKIRKDSSLTNNEKKFLLDELQKVFDKHKIGDNSSGNDEIDKLIQECQQKIVSPRYVIEWINYDQLSDGRTISTAIWKVGCYDKWNSEKQILERQK